MNIKLVGILFAVGSLLACGDDTSSGGSGGGPAGGGDNGGSPPAGGGDTGGAPGDGGAGGGGQALTCQTGCEALFNCGLEGTPPLCVYTAADEAAFVPGCVETCMGQMALLLLVDPADCPGTIEDVSNISTDFNDVCTNGIGQGGAGGGA